MSSLPTLHDRATAVVTTYDNVIGNSLTWQQGISLLNIILKEFHEVSRGGSSE
tara:strand:+ start:1369 stop:1527 length:159 start_codon:yes stop_codon:yes gene_type:complete